MWESMVTIQDYEDNTTLNIDLQRYIKMFKEEYIQMYDMPAPAKLTVLETREVDGKPWYSIQGNDEVITWLHDNVENEVVFYNMLKGVWVDVPERILILLKLKFL